MNQNFVRTCVHFHSALAALEPQTHVDVARTFHCGKCLVGLRGSFLVGAFRRKTQTIVVTFFKTNELTDRG